MAAITRAAIQLWLLVVLLLVAGGVVAWDVLRTTEEVEEVVDRYERVDARIVEATPKGEGVARTPQDWETPSDLTIVISTYGDGGRLGPQVTIRINGGMRWTLPYPPDETDEAAIAAWDREHLEPVLARLGDIAKSLVEAREGALVTIQTSRRRDGLAVPARVSTSIFRTLGEAGVTDVAFDDRPQ